MPSGHQQAWSEQLNGNSAKELALLQTRTSCDFGPMKAWRTKRKSLAAFSGQRFGGFACTALTLIASSLEHLQSFAWPGWEHVDARAISLASSGTGFVKGACWLLNQRHTSLAR